MKNFKSSHIYLIPWDLDIESNIYQCTIMVCNNILFVESQTELAASLLIGSLHHLNYFQSLSSQCLIGWWINWHEWGRVFCSRCSGQGFLYWEDQKKTQASPAPAAWQQATSQANNQRNTWSPADLWYQQVSSMGAMTSGWDCFWAEIFRNMWWLKKHPCFIHILLYMRNLALQYSTVCKI